MKTKQEYTKTCPVCNVTFTTTTPSKKYCGYECVKAAKREKDHLLSRAKRAEEERIARQAEKAKEKKLHEKREQVMAQIKEPVDLASLLYPDAVEVNTKIEGWTSGWIPVGDRTLPPELLAQQ